MMILEEKKERSDYYDDYGNVIAHVSTLLLRSRVSYTFIFLRESLNNGYFEEKTGISTIKLCKFILNFFFKGVHKEYIIHFGLNK